MITYLDELKKKIIKEFNPDKISLVDKSTLHSKHKSFDPNKFHLKLIIKSKKLKDMGKIESHRAVFSILEDDMKNRIHALEIVLE